MSDTPTATDLGVKSDLEALAAVLDVSGLNLADLGCGDGWLARELAMRGATVIAIEPEPEQARRNAEGETVPGVGFMEGSAEALPLADASLDGVLFNYSLHHVPVAAMATALAEARRVLRPGGFLYVADPVPEGGFAEVAAPFHDETAVQQAAERALAEHARPAFAEERVWRYVTHTRYAGFDAFVDDMLAPAYVRYRREQVDNPVVRERFQRRAAGDGYVLDQPVRINLFRSPRQP